MGGELAVGSSIIVNGKEENTLLTTSYSDSTKPAITDAEFTIGAINSKSFEGSIGFIEIFNIGSVIQTSKYHLVIYF